MMSQSDNETDLDDQLAAGFAGLNLHVYSHNEAVREITSFYSFISRMHPEDVAQIDYPPLSGWPQITQDTYSADTPAAVVNLLRHIPHLGSAPCLMNETTTINFLDHAIQLALSSAADSVGNENHLPQEDEVDTTNVDDDSDFESDSDEELPPHIITLACSGNLYGYNILLDTIRGVIIWCVTDGDFLPRDGLPPPDVLSLEEDPEIEYADYSWKIMPEYKITTFFEMCKEQFRILNWIPFMEGGGHVWSLVSNQDFDSDMGKRAEIMKDCGWPGDGEGRGWDRVRAERMTVDWQALARGEEIARSKGVATSKGTGPDGPEV